MAYNSYDKLWRSEFYNNVSAKDRVQDINLSQLKLKVNDTYKKDEKLTTKFELSNDEDGVNKAYLDEKLSKIESHVSYIEKDYNDFKLLSDKLSVEEFLIQRAIKTTVQLLFDKGLFDNYNNADEVFKDFLFIERRRPDLEEVNDVVQ